MLNGIDTKQKKDGMDPFNLPMYLENQISTFLSVIQFTAPYVQGRGWR